MKKVLQTGIGGRQRPKEYGDPRPVASVLLAGKTLSVAETNSAITQILDGQYGIVKARGVVSNGG